MLGFRVLAFLTLALWPITAVAQSSASFPDVGKPGTAAPTSSPPPTTAPTQTWSPDAAPPPYAAPAAYPAYGQPATSPTFGFGTTPSAPTRDTAVDDDEDESGGVGTTFWLGVGMVGVPYATGLGIAGGEGFANGSGWLAAPVLGPWLALSGRSDPCNGIDDEKEVDSDVGKCVAEPIVRGMLVLDGVLQATGVVLMVVGGTSGKKDEKGVPQPGFAAGPSVVGRAGYGVSALGSF